jgi:hypothetical protein
VIPSALNGAPFLRVEAVNFERRELLVLLADGDHGIYEIDGYWRGVQLPEGWPPRLYEKRATHCRFTVRGTEYEIPLGSNVGEIVPIGASA